MILLVLLNEKMNNIKWGLRQNKRIIIQINLSK